MIRILCVLKILKHAHAWMQKSSTCENDQNFMHVKNIKAHAHACKCKKSSICQNDQNFIYINILRYIYIYKYKKSSIYQNDQNFMNIRNIKV